MPTGYTAAVKDGKVTDFRTFALRCARAFGPCIMQRDDDPREEPRHREYSDFHEKLLRESQAKLKELLSMTVDQAGVLEAAERAETDRMRESYAAEKRQTRERYDAMIAKVEAWEAPTAQHVKYREFMLSQLRESIEFDCMDPLRLYPLTPAERPAAWLERQIERARQNVERHAVEVTKERQRCDEANAWIDALNASLPKEPTP